MKLFSYCLLILSFLLPGSRIISQCNAAFEWNQQGTSTVVLFMDHSTSEHQITSWHWNFGDGHMSDDPNPAHTYSGYGTYTVCLIITDNEGCASDVCHSVTIEGAPGCHADFAAFQIGTTLEVEFGDQSTAQHQIVSWHWNFGDGHMSEQQHPHHTFPEYGTYVVCLLIADEEGCASDICHEVTLTTPNDDCEADFEWESNSSGPVVHFFDNSASTHAIEHWTWNFGDGHMSDDENPVHEFAGPGVYNVCLLIVTESGCASDICHLVTVQGGDCEAAFEWEQGNGTIVHFIDHSDDDPDIVSWYWSFGDDHHSDDPNPVHTYEEPGTYVVCLVVENEFGCISDICHEVVVENNTGDCEAAFEWEQGNELIVHFIDHSDDDPDIVSWHWSFGDGHFSDNPNPVHTYLEPGVYTVCLLVVNEFGCAADICHQVVVEEIGGGDCEAQFTWQTSNLTVHFSDGSTQDPDITSWHWNFGDGHGSDDPNPTHTYSEPGIYLVCLVIVNEQQCVDEVCHEVAVETGGGDCEAAFEWESNDLVVHFIDHSDDDPDIVHWYWNFGDGHSSDDPNPTHTFHHNGVYVVCLTVTNEFGCTDQVCHEVTVDSNEDCFADFGWQQQGNSFEVNFNDLSSQDPDIVSWHWSFGDGHFSEIQNPNHTYENPGIYTVCLLIENEFGCVADICHQVIVEGSLPGFQAIFIYVPTDQPLEITFTDHSLSDHDVITWLWDFGDGTTSNEISPTHTFSHGGLFTVCLIVTNTLGQISITCNDVFVIDPNACQISFDFTFEMIGRELQFSNTSFGLTNETQYNWEFSDGYTSTDKDPAHVFPQPGIYEVCLTLLDNTNGCLEKHCTSVSYMMNWIDQQGGSETNHDQTGDTQTPNFQGGPVIVKYTNPASHQLTMLIESGKAGPATIELLDVMGGIKIKQSVNLQIAETNQVMMECSRLMPGIYMIRVIQENKMADTRMLVID